MITQKFSLEAMKNGVQETVYAKKGERAARTLSITLTSGGKVMNIAGYLVRTVFPDQTVLNLSNTNPIQFTIPQTLCASPGEYVCELQLRNAYNTEIFYSPMFRIIVEDSLTVTEPATQIGDDVTYVEAETGKSLMTDAERAKLADIETGAEVNVQSDWSQANASADDYIKNKPTNVSTFTNDAGYQNAAQVDALISDRVTKMLPLEFNITVFEAGQAAGSCNYSDEQIYQAIQDGKALQIVKLKDTDGEWIEGLTDFLQGEFLSFFEYDEYLGLTFVSDSNMNGIKPEAFFEISGNSVTIYTEGEKVLPDATAADAGKVPIVNNSGVYELQTIVLEQAQADWTQSTVTAPDYIKNKPTNVSAFTNDAGYLTSHQDISGKENISNKVTAISSLSTDAQYPSAKCVYDLIGDAQTAIDTLNSYISLELTAVIGGSY